MSLFFLKLYLHVLTFITCSRVASLLKDCFIGTFAHVCYLQEYVIDYYSELLRITIQNL